MPETIKLEDGTEREVPTQEELEELQNRSETRKKQREEIRQENEDIKQKLETYKNKDFNFKRLRDMTDEQKAKLSEQEKALMQKSEELEEQQKTFTQQIRGEWENEALLVLVGDDEETRKEVKENMKLLNIKGETKKDIQDMVRKAYNMTGKSAPVYNPFSFTQGAMGSGSSPKKETKNSKIDLDFAKKFGLSEDDIK